MKRSFVLLAMLTILGLSIEAQPIFLERTGDSFADFKFTNWAVFSAKFTSATAVKKDAIFTDMKGKPVDWAVYVSDTSTRGGRYYVTGYPAFYKWETGLALVAANYAGPGKPLPSVNFSDIGELYVTIEVSKDVASSLDIGSLFFVTGTLTEYDDSEIAGRRFLSVGVSQL